jgi:hypothetical protein
LTSTFDNLPLIWRLQHNEAASFVDDMPASSEETPPRIALAPGLLRVNLGL